MLNKISCKNAVYQNSPSESISCRCSVCWSTQIRCSGHHIFETLFMRAQCYSNLRISIVRTRLANCLQLGFCELLLSRRRRQVALVARGCCRVHEGTLWSLWLLQFGLSSFQGRDTKVDRFFGKKDEILERNYCIFSIDIVLRCQKAQKSDIQSQFSMSKMI